MTAVADDVKAAIGVKGGRMPSLVHELQRDAMKREIPVGDLLRKASVVARKLQIKEFSDWIACEQSGYAGKPVPLYRQIRGHLRAKNPYRGLIPLMMPTAEMAEALSEMPVQQPVSELEDLIARSNAKATFTFTFPPSTEHELMRTMEVPMQPMLLLSRSSLVGVVDAVRNTILEWSMTLEERGILGEGMSFSPEERQQAQVAVPTNVTNFYGNVSHSQVAPGASWPVQHVGIPGASLTGLHDLLRALIDAVDKLGASQEDRAELRAEVATIQAQLASPRPKNTIVTESLNSVQRILEGMAGDVLAAALLKQLLVVVT